MKYLKANYFTVKHGNSIYYYEVDDAQDIDHELAERLTRANITFTSDEVEMYGVIERQVIVLGTQMYWATWHAEKDGNYPITDQPEIYLKDLHHYLVIDACEFEDIWNRSLIE
jgi:hypothetical protein